MSTPCRFGDKEYTNWIKCSLALIHFKEGLHDFVKTEVTNFHAHIQQKIAKIPCGSSAGSHCGFCTWKSIKHTGGQQGVWYIKCQNKICDKWLSQILLEHNDPQNRSINWKNADINKWPTDGYEVAKVYMPKGQDKAKILPDDFDAPAILSLLKYCAWFNPKIQTTSILSDLIDLRNEVMHSGDLRVTDSKVNSCIDKMIQLMSELNIHGNVCTELQKTKIEDIDINFRETEVKALHNLVSSIKEKMDSLQDAQTQQMHDIEKVNDNTTETEGKVVTMETVIQGVKLEVEQLSEIYQKIKFFLANNPDIHDKNLSENIQAMEKTITALESKFEKKHKEIGRRITSMGANISGLKKGIKRKFKETEEKHQEIETKMTLMGTNIGGIKKGIKRKFKETGEKHKEINKKIILLGRKVRGIKKEVKRFTRKPNIQKDMSEAQKERRPETDGLRQLKNQTEDKLNTLRSLKCIPTKQAEEAKTLLEGKRSIVIRGNPGEGKTTTALYLIDNEMYRDKRVVLYSPQDWKTVDTEWVDIVVLEDIFGKFDLDSGSLQEWMVYLPTIEEHLDARKLQVIITTRDDILLKAYSMLGSHKLFSDDLTLTLSSKQLNDSEKISILNRELQRHNKNMKEDQKVKCIANFSGLVGFPQCCLLFAGDSKLFDRGPEFFRSPCKFFVANITKLEATRFLSLAFLFCKDKIYEENLSPETMPETDKHLLLELASNLRILEMNASITLLRDAYDIFLDLYVVKSMSYGFSFRSDKPCIQFTHATVCEAVGQVLGDRCPEMVVKYCDSEYLYQRTYTAKAKDVNSQNVFIPVSVYRCLAERMVCDVIKKGSLVQSVVKHSSLKQHDFLKKLKFELQKGNEIKSFFTASYNSWIINSDSSVSGEHLSEGKCYMFMQYILQSDDEVVRLVYSEFLEFLACAHDKNSSDCWKCQHKQMLLELALYYHHFEIADKLIHAGNVCYTRVSLCNAAKHGDLIRVQTILEALKRSQIFDPGCKEAKYALCRACLSGKNDLIEFLLQEGILADIRQVIDAVQCGDIGVLKKVVEHLKSHNKWNPHWEPNSTHENFVNFCQELETPVTYLRGNYIPYSTALFLSFCNEKFDMADYLLKNDVDMLMCMLPSLSKYCSQNAVKKAIQNLKDTGDWDPKSHYASGALENAYNKDLYDVYNLLMQEGVSLTMKNLYGMVGKASFESIKKAIQNLKDTGNWDPKCDDASKALENAYNEDLIDVYNLLMQEGVSLAMEKLYVMVGKASFESIKKAIQNLKDTGNWDPKSLYASKVLENAYKKDLYDVYNLQMQEGISLTMKDLYVMVFEASFEFLKKAIQNLQDTGNWDPKSHYASEALKHACINEEYDVYDLLIQKGVSLTMKNLSNMESMASCESIKKAIQNLKDTGNWDPKCDDASEALEHACINEEYNVWDLFVQEGVSLTMKNLNFMVGEVSFESIKKAIQNLTDTGNWDPKCDDAFEALEYACRCEEYDVCDFLVQKGVSLTMKNLYAMVGEASLESIKKAIQNLKDTGNWDPKCDDAFEALEHVYICEEYDVYNLLIQEGVSHTKKTLHVMVTDEYEIFKKAIQNLKDTGNWDPKCDDASTALILACHKGMYDKCDLLIHEGISLTMNNLLYLVSFVSFETIKKAIQNLKDTGNWDPKCDDASAALKCAYVYQKYDICDLLIQEGVSLTMKTFHSMVHNLSLAYIKNAVQNLKASGSWDPKCDYASNSLIIAFIAEKYDICNLLFQESISLSMNHLPSVVDSGSFESIKKAIQNLKDTGNWDHQCNGAFKALENAYSRKMYDVCELLFQESVSLPMKHLPSVVSSGSLESIKKAIQDLKHTGSWDHDGDNAFKALEIAFSKKMYDVCDLLVQEGISLTMKKLPIVVFCGSFKYVKKTIQHLKKTDSWDPECDDAYIALLNAYCQKQDDLYYLLIQKGISLTMKNLPHIVCSGRFKHIEEVIQHLKHTKIWVPECDDASEALENAYKHRKYEVCELLIKEGVSFNMKNHSLPVYNVNSESIKMAVQNMIYIDHCICCITCRVTQNTPRVWTSKLHDTVLFRRKRFSGILVPRFFRIATKHPYIFRGP